MYHETFESVPARGGLTGYAHLVGVGREMPSDDNGVIKGMAIDVPFGLVDFAEVMSLHFTPATAVWFDFLNLGYKLTPSAGTDYPWGDVPGTVRNYVNVSEPFTSQAWFDGLKDGRTFVTSGPMLEFSINGQGMGSEIRVGAGEELVIAAKASINPDVDALSELELIEQGVSARTTFSGGGVQEMELHYRTLAKRGTWFVLRARGKRASVLALSAPIYVIVDGQSFWKPAEVSAIVARLKFAMQAVLQPVHADSSDGWETQEFVEKHWKAQQSVLKKRIDQATAIYDDLVKRAATAPPSDQR